MANSNHYKQVVADLDEQIEYLTGLRAQILSIYEGEEKEAQTQQPAKAQKTRARKTAKRKYAPRGSNLQAILDVLQKSETPLTTQDLHIRLKINGWNPQTKDSLNLLGSTLRYAFEHGKVARVGNSWALMGYTGPNETSNETVEAVAV